MIKNFKEKRRKKIHRRVRSKVNGTSERPRLNIYKSSKHIYAQIINDEQGHTLMAVSTLTPVIREELKDKKPIERAHVVGRHIAEKALEQGITRIAFDRSGYPYHGRVQAIAEGAREGGLQF